MTERELAAAATGLADAIWRWAFPWLAAFGALENEEVRKNVIDGLNGAIVGAPADPEAFG